MEKTLRFRNNRVSHSNRAQVPPMIFESSEPTAAELNGNRWRPMVRRLLTPTYICKGQTAQISSSYASIYFMIDKSCVSLFIGRRKVIRITQVMNYFLARHLRLDQHRCLPHCSSIIYIGIIASHLLIFPVCHEVVFGFGLSP
jgi:hypothetical protein